MTSAVGLRRYRLPASWPFAVTKWPFFYGWMVWLLSTLGFLMSIPGQTMGMAVFTEPFMEAFGLSRTQLSMAYLFGTLGSALFLTRAGRLYDILGGRLMVVGASAVLGLVLLYFSVLDRLGPALTGNTVLMFMLVLLGYFGVRFSGQGVLTSASRNILMNWFERRRGAVSGIRGVFVSLGFSIAPLLLAAMIGLWGWRGALWVLAAGVGIGFSALALLLLRDDPRACGLLPDGAQPGPDQPATVSDLRLGLNDARRDPVFWTYSAALGVHSLLVTALTFHVVAIFAAAGRSSTEAFAYFFPTAVVSTSVNLFASWLADRSALKPFLLLMLSGFLTGACGLLMLDSSTGYMLMVLGFGVGGGLWGVLSNLAFVRFYGLLHLGEISGLNASLLVMASAIGPALFSLAADSFGDFNAAYWLCIAMISALLGVAIVVPQREPGQQG